MVYTHFPVEALRKESTPLYYYDMKLLSATLSAIAEASADSRFKVHYAVKANADEPVLRMIAEAGFGADTVSGGEIKAALAVGFGGEKIVYAGVGKTDTEIELGLDAGISCFNVESMAELEVIEEIAARKGKVAPVALRVNPNIDAHTHHYITTGLAENKFGINLELLNPIVDKAVKSEHLYLKGLHFHIGSQITDNPPFGVLCERINAMQDDFEARGIKFELINVGGGLGIDYDNPDENPIPDFKAYFDVFREKLNLREGQELHFELGRSVVAQCGSLITKVLYVKEGTKKKFVIVDGGFNDLVRPALYQAHHKIENITSEDATTAVYDVVGPVCESSDVFGVDETLPVTRRGDLLALRSAGAYGRIMASGYNCRPIAKGFYDY